MLVGWISCLGGCTAPEPPEGHSTVQNIAKWYESYRLGNKGKPPENEAAFVAYISKRVANRSVEVDVEKMFVSPRDGQKLEIHYGKPISMRRDLNLVVYEKEGYKGQKWVAFESGMTQIVDDAKLQELLAPK